MMFYFFFSIFVTVLFITLVILMFVVLYGPHESIFVGGGYEVPVALVDRIPFSHVFMFSHFPTAENEFWEMAFFLSTIFIFVVVVVIVVIVIVVIIVIIVVVPM